MPYWRTIANFALSKLFEPPCAACSATLSEPLGGAVCDRCWASVHQISPPVCLRCGDPLPSSLARVLAGATCHRCLDLTYSVDRSRAIGPYEGRLRDIVHALKYDGRRSIAPRLSAMMREVGADLLADAELVVPVPLHWHRERARGFNQAEDLARGLGLPVMPLLRRTVATRPQVDLPASERARNVRGAFALSRPLRLRVPLALPLRPFENLRVVPSNVEGRQAQGHPERSRGMSESPASAGNESKGLPSPSGLVIVLVDDVATTGATLEACASVLKAAGAKSVFALTAARVVSGRR